MDLVTLKMIQRLMITVVGLGVCVGGIWLFARAMAGRRRRAEGDSFSVEGAGWRARFVRASPGLLTLLAGLLLVWLSLDDSTIKRTENEGTDRGAVLESWLAATENIRGGENFSELADAIVGPEPLPKFKARNVKLESNATLEEIGKKEYGDAKFWRLVAALNQHHGYFRWTNAGPKTVLKAGSLIEIWDVSKFHGKSRETIVQIHSRDKAGAYEQMLGLANGGVVFSPDVQRKLEQTFKANEMDLVMAPANLADINTLEELALRYYQHKKHWKLIRWFNPTVVPTDADGTWRIPPGTKLWIFNIVP